LTAADRDQDVAAAARQVLHRNLDLVQKWIQDPRLTSSRLVLVGPEDLVAAPVWGMVRSAQVENPHRFVLVDAAAETAPAALFDAIDAGEQQLRVRGGVVTAARLLRIEDADATAEGSFDFDPDGTVLITGSSGGLGRLLAQHLVTRHGARNLLLTSRRGMDAAGMRELATELTELGAAVQVTAADVSDRASVARLLAGVDPAHPLTAVVHTAAVLDDGVVHALDSERVDRVLAPKAEGALHLHELTMNTPLRSFVLFSSLSSLLGGAGMAGYTAANAFLNALARHRRDRGQPAVALAWGLWELNSGMAGRLGAVDLNRMSRVGAVPMPAEEGLALFDAATSARDDAVLVPARLNLTELRRQAAIAPLPSLFAALVPARATERRAAAAGAAPGRVSAGSWAERLTNRSVEERQQLLLDLVRTQAAGVLGHTTADGVKAEQAFKDLGLDSLTAVELRNRLRIVTGLPLSPTLVFDHPTPAALARQLNNELSPDGEQDGTQPVLADLQRLEASLGKAGADDPELRDKVVARLQTLLWKWQDSNSASHSNGDRASDLDAVTDDEMFDFIDQELGSPDSY
jgi:NAD(P)-dependent dehydrogenase (short-subunit alcohol dehydrogenase family)/acyl carrier protein